MIVCAVEVVIVVGKPWVAKLGGMPQIAFGMEGDGEHWSKFLRLCDEMVIAGKQKTATTHIFGFKFCTS